jgi:hypothetical protein
MVINRQSNHMIPTLLLLILASSGLVSMFIILQPVSATDPPQMIESDSEFVIATGTWTAVETPNASGNSYLYSSESGDDTLTLDFSGTSIVVIYVENPNFGSFTVEIDNNAVRTVTTAAQETIFDARSTFEFLDDGAHTLRIIGIQGTVAIDGFYSVPLPFPELVTLFDDDFDDGRLPGWYEYPTFGLEDFVLPTEDGYALQLNGSYSRFSGMGGIRNIVVRSSVRIERGLASFDINQSAAGGYALQIELDGTVTLKRRTRILRSVTLDPFSPTQWFNIEWQNIDGRLKVFIDDVLVIVVNDSAPLQYGTFMVNNDGSEKAFWIDNFEILLVEDEYYALFAPRTPTPTRSVTTTPIP